MMTLLVRGRGRGLRSTSRGELLRGAGRVVLWLAVAVLIVRGIASTLAKEARPVASRAVPSEPVWPDEGARAFAVEFATTYLRVDREQGALAARTALAEFAAAEIVDALVPMTDGQQRGQNVLWAQPAGAARLDRRHALITVAAGISGKAPRTARLTVPVARGPRGGLVVYDLPSLAPAPGRADEAPPAGAPIIGQERAAIGDVLTRFLRAFVGGDRAGLVYLVPPGTRVAAAAGGFELLELGSLAAAGAERDGERVVLAGVRVRDRESRAVYALRYRVRLVRRERWYVAAIEDPMRG